MTRQILSRILKYKKSIRNGFNHLLVESADKKFDKILTYLEEEWGETVTTAFVKKVYDFLDILAEFPEIGSLEHTERNIRGFVIVRQLTLFYKIHGDSIILLNFFDNRQNPKRKRY